MKSKYSVSEAAKILGITRMGLHTSIRQGYVKAKFNKEGTEKFLLRKELERYAKYRYNKLMEQANKIKLSEFDRKLPPKELAQWTDKGGHVKGEGRTYPE